MSIISEFRKLSSEDKLKLLLYYQDTYENDGEDQIDDATFDTLVSIYEQETGLKYKEVGSEPRGVKVDLPYYMGSLDKIKGKNAEEDLARWTKTYNGPWVIQDKIDGISGLYVVRYINGQRIVKLYTRGNGVVGTDISHLLEYMKIPVPDFDIAIRGEIVLLHKDFEEFSSVMKNARNTASGVVNSKEPNIQIAKKLKFITYNIIDWGYDKIDQENQFKYLKAFKFDIPWYMVAQRLSVADLEDALKIRREETAYDIDGIVVTNNQVYDLEKDRNPRYAVAFKVDRFVETIVTDVIWEASKDGVLKPVVIYEPVEMSGATMSKASGKNAKFIVSRGIGPGARILITRAGDVIPDIVECLQPIDIDDLKLPSEEFVWNENQVEFILVNKDDNIKVQKEKINYFLHQLDVKNVGPGRVTLLFNSGYTTIYKILTVTAEEISIIPGLGDKSAQQIHDSIHIAISKASLPNVMAGSGIFGAGFGTRRFAMIMEIYPDILSLSELSYDEIVKAVRDIDGFDILAENFAECLPKFVVWLSEHPMIRLESVEVDEVEKDLVGMKVVFTGFRSSELEEAIKKRGGSVVTSVTKNTTLLVAKNLSDLKSKGKKAEELNIPIMLLEEFRRKFSL